jgi:cytohesin
MSSVILNRPTIFISSPSDVAAERKIAKQIAGEIVDRLLLPYKVYDWQEEFISSGRTFQEQVPTLSHPNCRVTICIFGERIGEPIDDFEAREVPSKFRRFSLSLDPSDQSKVPLTGSVYEYLEAMLGEKQGHGVVLLFAKGDTTILNDKLDFDKRNFGGGAYLRKLMEGVRPGGTEFERKSQGYMAGTAQLARFYDKIVGQRRVITFEGPADFRTKLKHALREALKLHRSGVSEAQLFKGLESYAARDHYAFFGREPDIRDVISALVAAERDSSRMPFIILSGKSGSGKTSLAKAGVAGGLAFKESTADRRYVAVDADVRKLARNGADKGRNPSWLARLGARVVRQFAGRAKRSDWTPIARLAHRIALATRLPALSRQVEGLAGRMDADILVSTLRPHLKAKGRREVIAPVIVLDQFEDCLALALGSPGAKKQFERDWLPIVDALAALAAERLAWVIVPLALEADVGERNWPEVLRELPVFAADRPLQPALPPDYFIGFPQEASRRLAIIKGPFEAINRPLDEPVVDRIRAELDLLAGQDDVAVLPLIGVLLRWINERRKAGLIAQLETTGNHVDVNKEATPHGVAGQNGGTSGHTEAALAAERTTNLVTLADIGPGFTLAAAIDDLGNAALQAFETSGEGGEEVPAAGLHRRAETEHVLDRLLDRFVTIELPDDTGDRPQPEIHLKTVGVGDPAASSRLTEDVVQLAALLQEARLLSKARTHSARLVHKRVLWHWQPAARWRERRERLLRLLPQLESAVRSAQRVRLSAELVHLVEEALFGGLELKGFEHLQKANLVEVLKNHHLTSSSGGDGAERIHAAITARHEDLARFYLENIAGKDGFRFDINARDAYGAAAPIIVRLADAGLANLVKLSIELRADLLLGDRTGRTVIHSLAAAGDHSTLTRVLDRLDKRTRQRAVNAATQETRWRPLHAAACSGSRETVLVLLRRNANALVETRSGNLPLHLAAQQGKLRVVKALLSNKAREQLSHRNTNGQTPLMAAANCGHGDVVAALLPNDGTPFATAMQGMSAAHFAALRGHASPIGPLFARIASQNLPQPSDALGQTPLHYAASLGHEAVVEALLRCKAPCDAEDAAGVTPLMLACRNNHRRIVALLLDSGADPTKQSKSREGSIWSVFSPLREAVRYGATEVVAFLVKRLDTNTLQTCLKARDALGLVPLHHAAHIGNTDIFAALVSAGARPDVSNDVGFTPLHVAAMAGNADIAALLVHRTAPNEQTDLGRTPLHLAARYGHAEAVKVLLEQDGISLAVRSIHGQTPLHLAAFHGHTDVVRILLGTNRLTPNDINAQDLEQERSTEALEQDELDESEVREPKGGKSRAKPHRLGSVPNGHAAREEPIPLRLLRSIGLRTALWSAAQSGSASCVALLLSANARTDIADVRGRTPMFAAAQAGSASCVDLLVSAGADAKLADVRGCTPLHAAALAASKSVVQILHRHLSVDVLDGRQRTPLFGAVRVAARGGDRQSEAVEVIDFLLQNGANVNHKNLFGNTSLHLACSLCDGLVVHKLLDAGAEPAATNVDGRTVLHAAAISGCGKATDAILQLAGTSVLNVQDCYKKTALHYAAANGNPGLVRRLLKAGSDPNLLNEDGSTALHLAALGGHTDAIEELARHGVDLDARAYKGATPLGLACMGNHIDALRKLLALGADANARGFMDLNALNTAAQFGYREAAQILLHAGADPKFSDQHGSTALHTAAKFGQAEIAGLLIRAGVFVDAVGYRGFTPLHSAARHGNCKIVEVLLLAGAHPQIVDKQFATPLHTAAQHGHVEIVALLLSRGADKAARDSRSKTALHLAARFANPGNAACVGRLLESRADTRAADRRGRLPAHDAAERGSADSYVALLRADAAATGIPDKDGITAHEIWTGRTDARQVQLPQPKAASERKMGLLARFARSIGLAGKGRERRH